MDSSVLMMPMATPSSAIPHMDQEMYDPEEASSHALDRALVQALDEPMDLANGLANEPPNKETERTCVQTNVFAPLFESPMSDDSLHHYANNGQTGQANDAKQRTLALLQSLSNKVAQMNGSMNHTNQPIASSPWPTNSWAAFGSATPAQTAQAMPWSAPSATGHTAQITQIAQAMPWSVPSPQTAAPYQGFYNGPPHEPNRAPQQPYPPPPPYYSLPNGLPSQPSYAQQAYQGYPQGQPQYYAPPPLAPMAQNNNMAHMAQHMAQPPQQPYHSPHSMPPPPPYIGSFIGSTIPPSHMTNSQVKPPSSSPEHLYSNPSFLKYMASRLCYRYASSGYCPGHDMTLMRQT